MDKVLILGASGLVGSAIIREFRGSFDLYGTYSHSSLDLPEEKRIHLDIYDIDTLKYSLKRIEPDIVISCLRGDFGQQLSFHRQLSAELKKKNTRLYYFSTANVFDDDFSKFYSESDSPAAESDYGQFKIDCENELRQTLGRKAVIIRIPAIWGKNSPRLNQLKNSLTNGEFVKVYRNLVCNNLLDSQLAEQLKYIIEHKLEGTFHLGTRDGMTQQAFYESLLDRLGEDQKILRPVQYDDRNHRYYFGLSSKRADLPDFFSCTNASVISGLMN